MRRRIVIPPRSSPFMATTVKMMESNVVVDQNRGLTRKKSFWEKLSHFCSPNTCMNLTVVDKDDIPEVASACWSRFIKPLLFVTVFVVVAIILVLYLQPKADSVCYLRVGCFSAVGSWAERPTLFNFFPQSPFVINTTYIITSRYNPQGKYVVRLPDPGHFRVINEAHIPWSQSSLIVFLIHGYTDDSTTWMQSLKDAFLAQAEDLIVILVDWRDGAMGYYPQIVSNTRVVAREISLFIQYIQRRFGRISPKRIHLVGHSLGAQISSYVGKYFANKSFEIYQITALDPAYPLFEGYSSDIRLHKRDARHVLAIHSNIGSFGLGMKNPVGTIDIYLNNGRDQRGCIRTGSIFKGQNVAPEEEPDQRKVEADILPKIISSFSNLKDLLACSHRRAYEWLEDVLWDLARNAYVNNSFHPVKTAPVIGYPIYWNNDTDIVHLANKRAVHFSFCQEQNDDKCWKLERNTDDAFFRLPSFESDNNFSSSFLVPTTDQSPFCVRYAYLEITTCPQVSLNSPFSENPEISENVTLLTLFQEAYTEEIPIYQGPLLHHSTVIKAWAEFPCDELQEPVHFKDFLPQNHQRNSNASHQDRNKSYLSVKLLVSLVEVSPENKKIISSTSKTTTPESATTEQQRPTLCVNDMKLTYFNETSTQIVRSRWIGRGDGAEFLIVSSGQCVQITFSSTETNGPI